MKILWLCNTPLMEVSKRIGRKSYTEGWLKGISDELKKQEEIELFFLCPQEKIKNTIKIVKNNISFFCFFKKDINTIVPQETVIGELTEILREIEPDLIHIFGTEYVHTLEMIEAANEKQKVMISIQGIISACAIHYLDGIPIKEIYKPSLQNNQLISMNLERNQFRYRGKNEISAIQKCFNIVGRTDWDEACVKSINPNCNYYKCNEIMRGSFYEFHWNINTAVKYSIFVSQAGYPLKGLHYLIKAVVYVKMKFPKVHIYIGGDKNFVEKNQITPYGKYVRKLIYTNKLDQNITFLGYQSEKKMCECYLKSNVTVVTSSLENSPNSIGEAMLLGTPVVASYVGGISNLLEHGKEGFLYPQYDTQTLAYYICKIFQNEDLAITLGINAKEKAKKLYDREKNIEKLVEIYHTIIKARL